MTRFTALLEDTLLTTFRTYLRHGLTHAFAAPLTYSDGLQLLLNIQGALEIVGKLYHVKKAGWQSILPNKYHGKSEEHLCRLLQNGELKTTIYSSSKDYFLKEFDWTEYDNELINNFQKYRNAVVHLGLSSVPKDITNDSLLLLLRVINRLNFHQVMPLENSYMDNLIKQLLGDDLWDQLIQNANYRFEAVDQAYEHCDKVYYCLECGNESWGEMPEEDIFCFTCGYKVPEYAISFINCPKCRHESSLVFDSLQEGGINVPAKCTVCGYLTKVRKCKECGIYSEAIEKKDCPICLQ
jgi:DNA-directed RNA polymerase subunit RPC12/RpoP